MTEPLTAEQSPANIIYSQCMRSELLFAKKETCEWRRCIAEKMYQERDAELGVEKGEFGELHMKTMSHWTANIANWPEASYHCNSEAVVMCEAIERASKDRAKQLLSAVAIRIQAPTKDVALCKTFPVRVFLDFVILQKSFRVEIDPRNVLLEWSPRKSLFAKLSAPTGGSSHMEFLARREGKYAITATVGKRLTANDLGIRLPAGVVQEPLEPALIEAIAELLRGQRAAAQVTAQKPTVKSLTPIPSEVEIETDRSFVFDDVVATFKEDCVADRHLSEIEQDLKWSANLGKMFGKNYVAPAPSELPSARLRLFSPSHPNLVAKPCETVVFEAAWLAKPETDTVTATYRGSSGKAQVRIAPKTTQPDNLQWSVQGATPLASPAGTTKFPIRLEAQSKNVLVTVRDTSTGKEEKASLRLEKPTVSSVSVEPSSAQVSLGDDQAFHARANFAESCLDSRFLDQDDGLGWSTGNHGQISVAGVFTAERPGQEKITAVLRGMPVASASVTIPLPDLVIDPPGVQLLLGEQQSFRASLRHYVDVTTSPNLNWRPSRTFTAGACGQFEIAASYRHPETGDERNAKATIDVDVPPARCIAIRQGISEALSGDAWNPLEQSKHWLEERERLAALGCDCDVPLDWLEQLRAQESKSQLGRVWQCQEFGFGYTCTKEGGPGSVGNHGRWHCVAPGGCDDFVLTVSQWNRETGELEIARTDLNCDFSRGLTADYRATVAGSGFSGERRINNIGSGLVKDKSLEGLWHPFSCSIVE